MTITAVDERKAVKEGIDAWIKAVEDRNISLLPKAVCQDADSVWIGAGIGEWLEGYKALEQAILAQNAALTDIHIDVTQETIHISSQDDMAWATNQWVFNARMGDQAIALPLRCTWILEKRQGRWVIIHFHKSAGIP